MTGSSIAEKLAGGMVYGSDGSRDVSRCEWNSHPKFSGVYLKHVISAEQTDGLFSSHLVKVAPGCSLDTHVHADQLELHEVITGHGLCRLVDMELAYEPGKMAVIRKGEEHRVEAGENGLIIMAKFFPALC